MKKVLCFVVSVISLSLYGSGEYHALCKHEGREEKVSHIDHLLRHEMHAIRSMSFLDPETCCQRGLRCCDDLLIPPVVFCFYLCCPDQPEEGVSHSVGCCGCCAGVSNPCCWALSLHRCCCECGHKESNHEKQCLDTHQMS